MLQKYKIEYCRYYKSMNAQATVCLENVLHWVTLPKCDE